MSIDPVGGNPSHPATWNRYSYALNNSLKYVDPFGLRPTNMTCDASGCTITVTPDAEAEGEAWHQRRVQQLRLALLGNWLALASQLGETARDVSYTSPRDYLNPTLTLHALEAFADGVVPFGDPFESYGFYDPAEEGLEHSRWIGSRTRDLELSIGGGYLLSASKALFGGGTWANTGRYLRIGHSFHQGWTHFGLRGQWIDRLLGRERTHIYLWRIWRGR